MIKFGKYRHYKDIEGKHLYQIIGIGRDSETLEEVVVYQGLYHSEEWGDKPIWVRPLKMFIETVEVNGKTLPRFKYIGD